MFCSVVWLCNEVIECAYICTEYSSSLLFCLICDAVIITDNRVLIVRIAEQRRTGQSG